MGVALERKKAVVDALHRRLATAQCVIGAGYAGLSVADLQELRRDAREAGVEVRVFKNSLARRAVAGTPFEAVAGELKGQLILGIAGDDAAALARVFDRFGDRHRVMELRFGALPGQPIGPEAVGRLARLPSRDEMRAQVARALQAPVASLARALADLPARLARSLAAVRDDRQQ